MYFMYSLYTYYEDICINDTFVHTCTYVYVMLWQCSDKMLLILKNDCQKI